MAQIGTFIVISLLVFVVVMFIADKLEEYRDKKANSRKRIYSVRYYSGILFADKVKVMVPDFERGRGFTELISLREDDDGIVEAEKLIEQIVTSYPLACGEHLDYDLYDFKMRKSCSLKSEIDFYEGKTTMKDLCSYIEIDCRKLPSKEARKVKSFFGRLVKAKQERANLSHATKIAKRFADFKGSDR